MGALDLSQVRAVASRNQRLDRVASHAVAVGFVRAKLVLPGVVGVLPLDCRELATLVDKDDLKTVGEFAWRAQRFPSGAFSYPHRVGMTFREDGSLSRFLMKPPPDMVVDHINGQVMDNRRCNLRVVTEQQNMLNRRRKKPRRFSSKYNGVSRVWAGWLCTIDAEKIGVFPSEIEAALAWDEQALIRRGEFAVLNFPDPEQDHG